MRRLLSQRQLTSFKARDSSLGCSGDMGTSEGVTCPCLGTAATQPQRDPLQVHMDIRPCTLGRTLPRG